MPKIKERRKNRLQIIKEEKELSQRIIKGLEETNKILNNERKNIREKN